MKHGQEQWDRFYETPDGWYPNEFIVRFMAKYIRKRTGLKSYKVFRPDVHRILDLGCGAGRHVVMFAREGFETAGIDISRNAVEFARSWLENDGLTADLKVGSATSLPWPDNHFDAVVSHGVLDHMRWDEAVMAVREVNRVVRPGGLFYLSLVSTDEFSFSRAVEVEPFAVILKEGEEEGIIQRFYKPEHIFELLEPAFRVLDVVYNSWHPTHGAGFSVLDINNAGRLARHHIACEVSKK